MCRKTKQTVTMIPDEIEVILPYSCSYVNCSMINLSTQSHLKCIDICSFYQSNIKSFFISSSCEFIEYLAFGGCKNLVEVKF